MNSPEMTDPPVTATTSTLKVCLPYVLSLAALLILAGYLSRNADRYKGLLNLSLGTIFSLGSLALVFALISGVINYFFYRALGVSMGLNESVGLAAINTLANQLPFAGGLVAKAAYLKHRHKLAYTRFLSATMALYVCFVAVNGAVALGVLAHRALLGSGEIPLSLLLGFFGMTSAVLTLWLPVDALSSLGKWGDRLIQLADGWPVLSQNVELVGVMAAFQIMMTLLFGARLWIAFRALSQDVAYGECVLLSSATVLTRLVSITPGGLGVREGIVAGLAALLGFEAGVSAVAVALDRLVSTAVIIALGTVYTYVLSKNAADPRPPDAPEG